MLPHLYVYAPTLSKRFQWIVNTFFGRWFQLPYELVSSAKSIPDGAIVLSYGAQLGRDREIYIPAHAQQCVLNEDMPSAPPIIKNGEEVELFPVSGGDIPVDIFSAAAFCMGRMEEYNSQSRDRHDRFPGSHSHASRNGYLHLALIDRYFNKLCNRCLEFCPDWSEYIVRMRDYHPTLDVDTVWAYRQKGMLKEWGGVLRAALSGRLSEVRKRLEAKRHPNVDPFNTFDRLNELHEQHDVSPYYFILSSRSSRYDIQNRLSSDAFRHWLKNFSADRDIGLHPGYSTYTSVDQLIRQKRLLEEWTGKQVLASRFHYLRFRLPEGYRNLVKAGFRADFTMAYADRPGFRAGTARPFNWFDMETGRTTDLVIYPFQIMDATLNKYLKTSPDEAIDLMKKLYIECRTVGGTFRTLWHNSSLSELGEWKGWSEVYAKWLDEYDEIHSSDSAH